LQALAEGEVAEVLLSLELGPSVAIGWPEDRGFLKVLSENVSAMNAVDLGCGCEVEAGSVLKTELNKVQGAADIDVDTTPGKLFAVFSTDLPGEMKHVLNIPRAEYRSELFVTRHVRATILFVRPNSEVR
jgi:hypothetical protein